MDKGGLNLEKLRKTNRVDIKANIKEKIADSKKVVAIDKKEKSDKG